MIVTIGNTKGGVGKSTLAFNVAVMRARAARRVWLINADKQGTLRTALAVRHAAGLPLPFAVDCLDDPARLRAKLEGQADRYDDVVIDVGGRDTRAFRAALVHSDVVVTPWPPRSAELWELPTMAQILEDARQHNPRLRVLSCLNQAEPSGADNFAAAAAIRAYPIFCHIDARITRRKAISDAFGRGLAVVEASPKSSKAVVEIEAFLRSVLAPSR